MDARSDVTDLIEVLRTSGEVGAALTEVDWSATPLGPPETWEASLRAVVRVVVSSRFSMWMGWGEDLTFFCNDAYRRDTLGAKYPWALGRPAREVWQEIWDDVGPRAEAVMRDGVATWDESLLLLLQRSGFAEETYHTFSYSPLTGDDGRVTGLLCVVVEETDRVVDAQRLSALRELGGIDGSGRDEAGYLAESAQVLARHDRPLSFSAIYVTTESDDPDGRRDRGGGGPREAARRLRLAATAGIETGHPALPARLEAGDHHHGWPMGRALAGELVEVALTDGRFGELPTGAWDEPPQAAVLVPLAASVPGAAPMGVLVVALNRFRPFDAGYRAFVELLAGQLSSGIAGARAYAAERRRAEELAALDAAKTTFFTNVSHELRTPLTLLLAPAEDLLEAPGGLDSAGRARVELIVRNGQRLLKLVNTLLDFSRLQSGRADARFERVDLATYTTELVAMFESPFVRAGLRLVLDLPPLPEPVWIDREMWAKIVLNLVSNALKFTLTGSVTVRLGPGDPGRARLEIIDTGVGISEAEQERLFERFHRVREQQGRSHEGTGIGLALVAELVDVQGGTISVTSRPGDGSTFTVEVPYGPEQLPADRLVPAPEDEAEPLSPAVRRTAATHLAEFDTWLTGVPGADPQVRDPPAPPSGDLPTVLVVDDNADMRRYITSLLEDRYRVEEAADGVAGLELALAAPPDLIVTDVMMPRLDGFGMLSALRADPRTMGIPVMMLSARAGEEGLVEGLEAGADDYLVKPFAARELHARVAANLELDRVRRIRNHLEHGRLMQEQAERLADVGSWEIDLRTDRLHGSTQFLRMLGMDEAELAAATPEAVIARVVTPADRPQILGMLHRAARTGEGFEYVVDVTDPPRVMRVRGEVVLDEAGEPYLLRGFMMDLTRQRQAEAAMAAAAVARESAEREHAIADELQRSLLPEGRLGSPGLDAASFYRAGVEGTRAGGDWFDVIDLGGTRTAVVIGDVSGRGVRAASLMGQLRAAIHAHARLDLPPSDVLEQLDRLVVDLGHGSLVTCIYGIHDHASSAFDFASAGHLPAIVVERDSGGCRRASVLPGRTGPPLGTGTARYGEHKVLVPPESTLVLYTDGLVERRREAIDDNIEALREFLEAYEGPLSSLPEALVPALAAEDVDDDIAVLALGIRPQLPTDRAEIELGSDLTEVRRARHFVADRLRDWEVSAAVSQAAVTIVSELVTNALLHARPPLVVRLRTDRRELLTIEVEDGLAAVPRRLHPDPTRAGGRGLGIVARLAERWSVRPTERGKAVWCVLRLGQAGSGQNSVAPSTSSISR